MVAGNRISLLLYTRIKKESYSYDLNVIATTIALLEKNVGINLCDLGLGKD